MHLLELLPASLGDAPREHLVPPGRSRRHRRCAPAVRRTSDVVDVVHRPVQIHPMRWQPSRRSRTLRLSRREQDVLRTACRRIDDGGEGSQEPLPNPALWSARPIAELTSPEARLRRGSTRTCDRVRRLWFGAPDRGRTSSARRPAPSPTRVPPPLPWAGLGPAGDERRRPRGRDVRPRLRGGTRRHRGRARARRHRVSGRTCPRHRPGRPAGHPCGRARAALARCIPARVLLGAPRTGRHAGTRGGHGSRGSGPRGAGRGRRSTPRPGREPIPRSVGRPRCPGLAADRGHSGPSQRGGALPDPSRRCPARPRGCGDREPGAGIAGDGFVPARRPRASGARESGDAGTRHDADHRHDRCRGRGRSSA